MGVVGAELSPLTVRRWERCELAGGVTAEVQRLNALQAAPYRQATQAAARAMLDMQAEIEAARATLPPEPAQPDGAPAHPGDGASDAEREQYSAACERFERAHPEYTAALREHLRASLSVAALARELAARMITLIPADLVQRAFEVHVRNVSGLVADDAPITTGAELLEVADEQMVSAVLAHLRRLFELRPTEGKVSASRSTLLPEEATTDGASVAASTDAEGGPAR